MIIAIPHLFGDQATSINVASTYRVLDFQADNETSADMPQEFSVEIEMRCY